MRWTEVALFTEADTFELVNERCEPVLDAELGQWAQAIRDAARVVTSPML